jgi:predicted DNA-binding transcriptional regulator AlpA
MLDDQDNREVDAEAARAVFINPNRLDRMALLCVKQACWYMGGYTRQHLAREVRNAGSDFPRPLPVGPNRIGFNAEEVAAWIMRRANARRGRELPFAYTDQAVDVMERLAKLRLVRWEEVQRIFLFTRQHVRRKQRADPTFPRQVQVGPNRVCWVAGEIEAWLLALETATRVKGE